MDPVTSVRELQQCIARGGNCKMPLGESERLRKCIVEAQVVDKLDAGIQLIPRDITRILLAAICEIGTIVAKAHFEGYALGLKRKGDDLFLYFSKKTGGQLDGSENAD